MSSLLALLNRNEYFQNRGFYKLVEEQGIAVQALTMTVIGHFSLGLKLDGAVGVCELLSVSPEVTLHSTVLWLKVNSYDGVSNKAK